MCSLLALSLGSLTAAASTKEQDVRTELLSYPFDESSQGFEPVDPYALWEYGEPADGMAGAGAGVVWTTGLSTLYIKNTRSSLFSPPLELGSITSEQADDLTLELTHAYATDLSTGDCAGALALNPYDDASCADGGLLRFWPASAVAPVLLTASPAYTDVAALDGQPVEVFAGSSTGYVTSFFDLKGLGAVEGGLLELLFTSNNVRTSTGSGWYISRLALYQGDVIPPQLEIDAKPDDTCNIQGPYEIVVGGKDNRSIAQVLLFWDRGANTAVVSKEMEPNLENGSWQATIEGQPSGTTVRYWIEGQDTSGNGGRLPPFDYYSFVVTLPSPLNLRIPSHAAEVLTAALEWEAPNLATSDHSECQNYTIAGYEVLHQARNAAGEVREVERIDVLDPEVVTSNGGIRYRTQVKPVGVPETDVFQVRAIYQLDQEQTRGSFSQPVSEQFVVPQLLSITPSQLWQGSRVDFSLEALYTRFVDGAVDVKMPPGVTVEQLTVLDANRLSVRAQVSEQAPLGEQAIVIVWPGYELQVPDAFEIAPFSERPQLLTPEPSFTTQRQKETIKFTGLNTDFKSESLVVSFGPGIEVGSVDVLDAQTFEISIEVDPWAATGTRTLLVVSGELSFDVPFEVRAASVEPVGTCAYTDQPDGDGGAFAPWMSAVLAVFLVRRQRRARVFWHRGGYVQERTETHPRHDAGPGVDGSNPSPGRRGCSCP